MTKPHPVEPLKSGAQVISRDAILIALFLGLAAMCWHQSGPLGVDRWLLGNYVPTRSTLVFKIANVLTSLGSPGVVVVLGFGLAALVWLRYRSMPWAVASIFSPGIAGAAEAVLKLVIARPRPITAALTGEGGNGFPSGHAAGFAALAIIAAYVVTACGPGLRGVMLARVPRPFLLAAAVSLAMALTRVFVGAHYPTDVLAGLLVGIVSADVVAFATRLFVQGSFSTRYAQLGIHRSEGTS